MQVAAVVVMKNGEVENCYTLLGHEQGGVVQGKYAGQSLSAAVEELFYQQCRKIDSSLPEQMVSEEEELPDNYPDFDGGVFHHENQTVCLCWPTMV